MSTTNVSTEWLLTLTKLSRSYVRIIYANAVQKNKLLPSKQLEFIKATRRVSRGTLSKSAKLPHSHKCLLLHFNVL